jgi:formate hydrogenlyase subunit 3/multisubunit Na+/H+ antiporter MnhD subunit
MFYPDQIFQYLLIIAFGGAFLTFFLGKISQGLRNTFAIIISLVLLLMVAGLYNLEKSVVFYTFFDFPLILRINTFSWLFAIAIALLILYLLGDHVVEYLHPR